MGSTVSVYLRYNGTTALLVARAMEATNGSTCFVTNDSFNYRTRPGTVSDEGWAEFSIASMDLAHDPDDLPGTALEPYSHELIIFVREVLGKDRLALIEEQAWLLFRKLQVLEIPLLLADENTRAFADYLPGRSPEERRFPDGTTTDQESLGHWTSSLYSTRPRTPAVEPARHPIVAFRVGKLLCIGPANASAQPTRPTFAVLEDSVPFQRIDEVARAAQSGPSDNSGNASAVIYEDLAAMTGSSIDDAKGSRHTVIGPEEQDVGRLLLAR